MCVRSNINRKPFVSYGKPHEGPAYNYEVMRDIVDCMGDASETVKAFALMDKGYTSRQILIFLEANQKPVVTAPRDITKQIEDELNRLRL